MMWQLVVGKNTDADNEIYDDNNCSDANTYSISSYKINQNIIIVIIVDMFVAIITIIIIIIIIITKCSLQQSLTPIHFHSRIPGYILHKGPDQLTSDPDKRK